MKWFLAVTSLLTIMAGSAAASTSSTEEQPLHNLRSAGGEKRRVGAANASRFKSQPQEVFVKEVLERRLVVAACDSTKCEASDPNSQGCWEPEAGVAEADGNISEWSPSDFLARMTRSGGTHDGGDNTAYLSKAYARWNCQTSEICVLVLVDGYKPGGGQYPVADIANPPDVAGKCVVQSPGDSYLKDYGTSPQTTLTTDKWVLDQPNGKTVGWEGCWYRASPEVECRRSVQIHANVQNCDSTGGTDTTSTGKPGFENTIALYLPDCPCSSDDHCDQTNSCVPQECRASDGSLCSGSQGCSCVDAYINGCECDADADCPAPTDQCLEGFCDNGLTDKSTWKCAERAKATPPAGCNEDVGDCTIATANADCFDLITGDATQGSAVATCATASCVDSDEDSIPDTCQYSAKYSDSSTGCGGLYVPTDSCDLGKFCNGVGCDIKYERDGGACQIAVADFPVDKTADCIIQTCKLDDTTSLLSAPWAKTVCGFDDKDDGSACGIGSPTGDCHKGYECQTGKCTDLGFKSSTEVCRVSAGCCDKPDTCDGEDYSCPEINDKFGDDAACRPSCGEADPIETCDGVNDACPVNEVLQDDWCLFAGQTTPAGTVSVSSTSAGDGGYNVCLDITLADNYDLAGSSETIKIHFGPGTPESSPGQYAYKYPGNIEQTTTSPEAYRLCVPLTAGELCNGAPYNIAIHLDVFGGPGSKGDTAWALPCVESTKIDSNQFIKYLGKQGKPVAQGWGKFFTWNPACPNTCELECPGCDPVVGGVCPPPSPPPTPPPPPGPTPASYVCNEWTCPDGATCGTTSTCVADQATCPGSPP